MAINERMARAAGWSYAWTAKLGQEWWNTPEKEVKRIPDYQHDLNAAMQWVREVANKAGFFLSTRQCQRTGEHGARLDSEAKGQTSGEWWKYELSAAICLAAGELLDKGLVPASPEGHDEAPRRRKEPEDG